MKKQFLAYFLFAVLVVALPTEWLLSAPPRLAERGLVMEDISTPAKVEEKSDDKQRSDFPSQVFEFGRDHGKCKSEEKESQVYGHITQGLIAEQREIV